MMSPMIIWLLQQFFNSNCNDESPNSEPKPRNKIANVCVLVNRWMISPRFKSCPRIFPNFDVLARRTHCFKSGKQGQFVLQYSPWKCGRLGLAAKPIRAEYCTSCTVSWDSSVVRLVNNNLVGLRS